MPTYQYTCTDCGEPVEALQKFTDEPLTRMRRLRWQARKVFSPVGIVFKGSGFYRTDSRNGRSAVTQRQVREVEQQRPRLDSSSLDLNGTGNGKADKTAKKS